MTKQGQWVIGGLALLIAGFMALQVYLHVDMKGFREELAGPEPKTETETEQQPPEQVQVPEVNNRPPPPDDGREYEWHGDHWDPVDAPVLPSPTKTKTYDKLLTYDEELLRTNPVEALRREAEARGHWAAKYIPPFPPDDLEAQEYARYMYITTYMNIQDANELWDIVLKRQDLKRQLEKKYGKWSARAYDLWRLTWPFHNSPGADFYDLVEWYPSEYFPTLDPDNDATPVPIKRQKEMIERRK